MAPPNKSRGVHKQPDLDLGKYIPSLDDVPDDQVLGRLQGALEILISERSHPMVVALQKQLERLKTAESVIEHEMEARKTRKSQPSSAVNSQEPQSKVKSEDDVEPDDDVSQSPTDQQPASETSNSVQENDNDEKLTSPSSDENDDNNTDSKDVSDDVVAEDKDVEMEDINSEVKAEGDSEAVKEELSDESEKKSLENENQEDDNDNNNDENSSGKVAEKSTSEPTSDQVNDDGSRPGNSKFLLNPKSEFVSTQTMPKHALGIFNEDQEDADDDEYKKRLGVVSYPKEDLSTLTAGPVPMDDFTRSKPTNQIQFQTYSTFLEPYFRPFTDEDLHFLQKPLNGNTLEATNLRTGQKLSPYAFPPLGPHYHQQWAQQDAEISGVEMSESTKKSSSAEIEQLKRQYQVYGSIHNVNDKVLETSINDTQYSIGDKTEASKVGTTASPQLSTVGSSSRAISLGPFTERLIAAIMPEVHEVPVPANEEEESSPPVFEKSTSLIPPISTSCPPLDDFAHLEDRLKDEFRYVGVFDMSVVRKFESQKGEYKLAVPQHHDEFGGEGGGVNIDWVNGAEDDEISRELRVLQRKLKEVSARNTVYKRRLVPVMQEQLAWQEYQSILMDLDKQVDQAYTKRLKAPKAGAPPKIKKRKVDSPAGADSPDLAVVEEKYIDQKPAIKALMEKRERWINKIGPLFRPAYEMMREYEKPKFENIEQEEEAQEEDEDEE